MSRELDALVAEKVMGWTQVHFDCKNFLYGLTKGPLGFVYEQPVPAFTDFVSDDYQVLKHVRDTWNYAQQYIFDIELTRLWNVRRKAVETEKEQGKLSAFVIWYEPGDYSKTALKAIGQI